TTLRTSSVHFQQSARSFCFQRPTSSQEVKVEQTTAGRSSSLGGGFSSWVRRGTLVAFQTYRRAPAFAGCAGARLSAPPSHVEGLGLGQAHAELVGDHGEGDVAEGVAREELPGVLGVLAAHGPLDLDDVAHLQAGEADDELLVGVVAEEVGADVAQVDVARLDVAHLPPRLLAPAQLEPH